ncbi:FKBP-type peptidyl-prolyl cis-trans isomerase [Crocinitomix sp.]|nr:FKBP-type peptidyl-prolyl cis-trans isomerase [Crocinitomix sp.]
MNSRILKLAAVAVLAGITISCESEDKFLVSEDGYEYKYIVNGEGDVPNQDEVVVYNMMYMNEKDSVLFESTADQPAMILCDTAQWSAMGPLYKAFKMIKEGDSILVKIPTKILFAETFRATIPEGIDPEGAITFCIGASKIYSQQEMEAEALEANRAQLDADIQIIKDFLTANNITAQSTESGLHYVVENPVEGENPQAGQTVFVHYTGTLLDGTQFDTSIDRGEPLSFPLGQGRVIQGWDEGIALLKKGEKATLYIPSTLAYGPRGSGALIGPNSVLKFEVELVDFQ